MTEAAVREEICRVGASLFNRGLTHGSTGNISVRLADGGWLMTPTGSSLGMLESHVDGRVGRVEPLCLAKPCQGLVEATVM